MPNLTLSGCPVSMYFEYSGDEAHQANPNVLVLEASIAQAVCRAQIMADRPYLIGARVANVTRMDGERGEPVIMNERKFSWRDQAQAGGAFVKTIKADLGTIGRDYSLVGRFWIGLRSQLLLFIGEMYRYSRPQMIDF